MEKENRRVLGIWFREFYDPRRFGKTEPKVLPCLKKKKRIENKAISKA
jgi:hypothetical protein